MNGEKPLSGVDRTAQMSLSTSPYLVSSAMDGAVSLVTSSRGGRQNVMTVSFFAESSHVPVFLRVAIDPASLTHEYISETGWFGLSVLAGNQRQWAAGCGTASGREVDKFERLGLRRRESRHHVPLLPDCLTTSLCKVVETLELADHTLFVGEIVESYRQSRLAFDRPLLVSQLIDSLSL